jgi:hypothetical protein
VDNARAIDDPNAALRILTGYVDLFATPVSDGVAGARHHICRIEAPGVLVGLSPAIKEKHGIMVKTLAVGGQGTEAELLDRAMISRTEMEVWVSRLSGAIATAGPAWQAREAAPGSILVLEPIVCENCGSALCRAGGRGCASGAAWFADSAAAARMVEGRRRTARRHERRSRQSGRDRAGFITALRHCRSTTRNRAVEH